MTGLRRRKAEVKKILRISHPIHPDMQRLTTSPYNSHKSYKSPGSFRLFSFLDKDLTRISGKITKDFQKGENKARSFDVVLKRWWTNLHEQEPYIGSWLGQPESLHVREPVMPGVQYFWLQTQSLSFLSGLLLIIMRHRIRAVCKPRII